MPRNKVKSRGGEDHSRGGGRKRTSNTRRKKISHIRKQELGAVGYVHIIGSFLMVYLMIFLPCFNTGLIHLKTEFQALTVKRTWGQSLSSMATEKEERFIRLHPSN